MGLLILGLGGFGARSHRTAGSPVGEVWRQSIPVRIMARELQQRIAAIEPVRRAVSFPEAQLALGTARCLQSWCVFAG